MSIEQPKLPEKLDASAGIYERIQFTEIHWEAWSKHSVRLKNVDGKYYIKLNTCISKENYLMLGREIRFRDAETLSLFLLLEEPSNIES